MKRKIKSVEEKLVAAVRRARKNGFRVVRGEFYRPAEGRKLPRCCPVEALCPGISEGASLRRAAEALGVSDREVWCFVEGLDGGQLAERPAGGLQREMFDLGARLRRELRVR